MEDFLTSTTSSEKFKSSSSKQYQKLGKNGISFPHKRAFEQNKIIIENVNFGQESNAPKRQKRTTIEEWQQLREDQTKNHNKGHSEFFSEDIIPAPKTTSTSSTASKHNGFSKRPSNSNSQSFSISSSTLSSSTVHQNPIDLTSSQSKLKIRRKMKKRTPLFPREEINTPQELFKLQGVITLEEELEKEKQNKEVRIRLEQIQKLENELNLKDRIVDILLQLEGQIGPILPPPSNPGDEPISMSPTPLLPSVVSLTSSIDPFLALKDSTHWSRTQTKNFKPVPVLFKELKDNLKQLEVLENQV